MNKAAIKKIFGRNYFPVFNRLFGNQNLFVHDKDGDKACIAEVKTVDNRNFNGARIYLRVKGRMRVLAEVGTIATDAQAIAYLREKHKVDAKPTAEAVDTVRRKFRNEDFDTAVEILEQHMIDGAVAVYNRGYLIAGNRRLFGYAPDQAAAKLFLDELLDGKAVKTPVDEQETEGKGVAAPEVEKRNGEAPKGVVVAPCNEWRPEDTQELELMLKVAQPLNDRIAFLHAAKRMGMAAPVYEGYVRASLQSWLDEESRITRYLFKRDDIYTDYLQIEGNGTCISHYGVVLAEFELRKNGYTISVKLLEMSITPDTEIPFVLQVSSNVLCERLNTVCDKYEMKPASFENIRGLITDATRAIKTLREWKN